MLYHMKPFDMRGDVLYPLNAMKDIYPDIYEKQIAKYDDHPSRKKLPLRRIPKLDCLWNDVIQCAPVHPHLIYPDPYEELTAVPPDALAWYDSLVEKGRAFGHFVGIPHVLIQGTIDVSDVETIVWSESP